MIPSKQSLGDDMKKTAFFTLFLSFLIISLAFSCVYLSGNSLSRQNELSLLGIDQLVERIQSEINFSRRLLALHPEKAGQWENLISEASDILMSALQQPHKQEFINAVLNAEKVLSPIGTVAKTYTIHCVGHAHIDMNWMWPWPETVAVTNDTFITVLKLMEEFPDFCFTQSQGSVYALIKKYNPELFEKIKKRVDEGRWEIAAVHWVEGDKNLASGESLVRHLLYTRQFMRDNFSLEPEDIPLDWEPDTFGHALTIPSIVSRAGVNYYYLCRGGNFEKPPIFWWKAPDGSRILVNLETTWYNSTIGPHNALELLDFAEETGLRDWMKVYGVGDHGGGPTRRDILQCHKMNRWPIFPNFEMSTAQGYFSLLENHKDKFPVLDKELNFEFTGCYTSQSQIKKFNRLGENQAVEAETAALLAHRILGREYPYQQLKDAWINILFGHFHDILPGSGVRATREFQSGLFQESAAVFGTVKSTSLGAIAEKIDTSFGTLQKDSSFLKIGQDTSMGAGAGRGTSNGYLSSVVHQRNGSLPIVVFNPSTWQRNELVRVSVWDADDKDIRQSIVEKSFVVRTSEGEVIPTYQVKAGNYWGHVYIDLVFPVSVGPLGYKSFCIEERYDDVREDLKNDRARVNLAEEFLGFENEYISARFDRMTGGIVQLVDKKTGADLADRENPMALLEYILERPGGMSAWVIQDPKKRVCPLELDSLKVDQHNPYLASIQAKARLNQSDLTITYILRAGEPWLEIAVEAFWLEHGSSEIGIPTIRIRYPTCLRQPKARYEIPFGSIERSLNRGEEVPSLQWANVSGQLKNSSVEGGLLLLNDCKYGHSLEESTLRLTLIRSSFSPDPLPELGNHTMRMALVPYGGDLTPAEMVRLGASFNHPLQIIYTDTHKGTLPSDANFLVAIDPSNIIVSGLKMAEDENAIIVRLYEADGKGATARLNFNPLLWGEIADAEQVDLLERPLKDLTVRLLEKSVEVELSPYGIVTLKLKFR
jgi:alpha-mannosidase